MVNEDLENTLNNLYESNNKILDFKDIQNTTYNFFKLDSTFVLSNMLLKSYFSSNKFPII